MTFPTFAAGEVLGAADMNAVGWWLVKKQNISTSPSVPSVVVNDAFNANYVNYRIIYTGGTASAQTGLNLTLGASGGSYFHNLFYSLYTGGGIQILPYNNQASFIYAGAMDSNQNPFAAIDLYEPFVARSTRISTQWIQTDSSGFSAGVHKVNASYTSFTLTAQTGTFNGGTIYVYGYKP